jgi:hypothetical protein
LPVTRTQLRNGPFALFDPDGDFLVLGLEFQLSFAIEMEPMDERRANRSRSGCTALLRGAPPSYNGVLLFRDFAPSLGSGRWPISSTHTTNG